MTWQSRFSILVLVVLGLEIAVFVFVSGELWRLGYGY
jgi:hypothetical protein